MEVRIGVQQAPREVVLTSDKKPADISKAVGAALKSGDVLTLTDVRGRTVMIPADKLAYVEIGPAEERPVGFAG